MPPRQTASSSASELAEPAQQETAHAFAAARAICRKSSGGYFLAAKFLPRAKRDAVYAVGAFLSMISEVVRPPAANAENPPSSCAPGDASSAMVRDRLDDVYADHLDLPKPEFRSEQQHVLHAATLTIHRYAIPRELFLEYLQGLERDGKVQRYATWSSLESHCAMTGGVAARIVGCVLGFTHSQTSDAAARIGNAVRLTQILCSVGADAKRGRVYLPLEDLARFRYSERDLAGEVTNTALRELMRFEIERAIGLFNEGAQGLRWISTDGARLSTAVVIEWQRQILASIERQNYDVFSKEPKLRFVQRLKVLGGAWAATRRAAAE